MFVCAYHYQNFMLEPNLQAHLFRVISFSLAPK